jgi:hypothetical protein
MPTHTSLQDPKQLELHKPSDQFDKISAQSHQVQVLSPHDRKQENKLQGTLSTPDIQEPARSLKGALKSQKSISKGQV